MCERNVSQIETTNTRLLKHMPTTTVHELFSGVPNYASVHTCVQNDNMLERIILVAFLNLYCITCSRPPLVSFHPQRRSQLIRPVAGALTHISLSNRPPVQHLK